MMVNYTHCPICNNSSFSCFLTCEDHTVSHEKFNIVSCDSCQFKFTNPIPELTRLGDYYKSEDYISHSNTKKGIVPTLYHSVRKFTLKQKLALVSRFVPRGTILDFGCGTGMFLKHCIENKWSGTGIEPDSGARKLAGESGAKIYPDKESLGNSIEFDAITLWHVLEHVPDLNETLKYFQTQLKTQGVLIIAVPNHFSADAEHYKEHWAAYDVPRHLYHFSPASLIRLCESHGFTYVEQKPMLFDSFYVSMLSEKYQTGSINYLKAFSQGLRSNLKAQSTGHYSSLIYIFKKR